MPPPSLSTTTIRRSADRSRRRTSALESCTNAMSPTRTTVGVPVSARPSAVDTTPSMPLAPRFAWARASGPPNHSRSRTGIEDATTSSTSAGSDAAMTCATPGSVSDSSAASVTSIASNARFSACRQRAAHVVPVAPRRSSRSSIAHTIATSCPGSTTPGPPTWTTAGAERAIHSESTLDAGGRPMRTTTSGACASANSRCRSNASNVVTAAGDDRAPLTGSASTGHPVASASAAMRSTGTPPRPPATMTPRWRSTTAPNPALAA